MTQPLRCFPESGPFGEKIERAELDYLAG